MIIAKRICFLSACITLIFAPLAHAGSTQVSEGIVVKVPDVPNPENATVELDWDAIRTRVGQNFAKPLMDNACSTQAKVVDTRITNSPTGKTSTISLLVDVRRNQCIDIKELKCRGLTCKPQISKIRTNLFAGKFTLDYDIDAGISSNEGLALRPDPESIKSVVNKFGTRIPELDSISQLISARLEGVLERTAASINTAIPQNIKSGETNAIATIAPRENAVNSQSLQIEFMILP